MGKIHKGILKNISEFISEKYNVKNFIETGTYRGDSLPWASNVFEKVSTIEINNTFFQEALLKYQNNNVDFYLGDSRNVLKDLKIMEPTLFWLDAHSGGGNFGVEDDCPLLDELKHIVSLPNAHFIIIDDVYAFCFPLPPPFNWKAWPSLNDIFNILDKHYAIMIKDNFLLAIPKEQEGQLKEFLSRL